MNTYSTYTDNELLGLLSQNDIEAFDNLYTRHWAEMYKYAFIILKEQDACKDIVQNIFVWLWEHRQVLEIHTLRSYLKAAVKFKVANYIRSKKIRESFFEELADYSPPTMVSNAEEMAEINELKTIIHQAIIVLPDKCRKIFRLSREEFLSNKDIADRLGISVKTVENQMTIALNRIRRTLE
ncbi:MAG: RNA polymerase sigma-70 factor [Ginsengibacter sp.]